MVGRFTTTSLIGLIFRLSVPMNAWNLVGFSKKIKKLKNHNSTNINGEKRVCKGPPDGKKLVEKKCKVFTTPTTVTRQCEHEWKKIKDIFHLYYL